MQWYFQSIIAWPDLKQGSINAAMKILVTGATSVIGKEVVSLLLNDGHEVISVTRQTTTAPELEKTQVLIYDLCHLPEEALTGMDAVIHIAAATPGAKSTPDDYRKTNIESTRRLLAICEKQQVKRFIYISSIVVLYEDYNDDYSTSKRAAEAMVVQSKTDWTILRPAEVIGADNSWKKFLQLLQNKKAVMVPGNGKQLRHPVFFRDVVKAILQVLNNTKTYGWHYVLATAQPVTYHQYLKLVRKIFNCHYAIIIVPQWLLKSTSAFKSVMPGKVKRKLIRSFALIRDFNFDIQNGIKDFNYTPLSVEQALLELKKITEE